MPRSHQMGIRIPTGLFKEAQAWGAQLDRPVAEIVVRGLRLALADLRARYPEYTALVCPPAQAEKPDA